MKTYLVECSYWAKYRKTIRIKNYKTTIIIEQQKSAQEEKQYIMESTQHKLELKDPEFRVFKEINYKII